MPSTTSTFMHDHVLLCEEDDLCHDDGEAGEDEQKDGHAVQSLTISN